MNVDITQIIVSLVGVIIAIASAMIIPLIKNHLTANQLNLLKMITSTAVQAAEQLYASDQWKQKKLFVIEYLRTKGFDVDTDEVNIEIESAVLELHNQLYGTEKVYSETTPTSSVTGENPAADVDVAN